MDRWTARGIYDFIRENSQLKQLLEVARFENFNSSQIAVVGDNGQIRGFEIINGTVSKSKLLN